jgi:hypothetical protein
MFAIITVPSYADIVNTTTTAFGQSLFTDLLPWVGALAFIAVAALLLVKARGAVVGGIAKMVGSRRKGGRRRGRR